MKIGKNIFNIWMLYFQTRGSKLEIEPEQVLFVAKNITFLGHVVNNESTKPNPSKIDVVLHFPKPKTVIKINSFLGLTGYYRNYVQGY
jgi:hypothetical protein